jgi:hypothetical protein
MSNFFSRLFCSDDKDLKNVIKDLVSDDEMMVVLRKLFTLWHQTTRLSYIYFVDIDGKIKPDEVKKQIKYCVDRIVEMELGSNLIERIYDRFSERIENAYADKGNFPLDLSKDYNEIFEEVMSDYFAEN